LSRFSSEESAGQGTEEPTPESSDEDIVDAEIVEDDEPKDPKAPQEPKK